MRDAMASNETETPAELSAAGSICKGIDSWTAVCGNLIAGIEERLERERASARGGEERGR